MATPCRLRLFLDNLHLFDTQFWNTNNPAWHLLVVCSHLCFAHDSCMLCLCEMLHFCTHALSLSLSSFTMSSLYSSGFLLAIMVSVYTFQSFTQTIANVYGKGKTEIVNPVLPLPLPLPFWLMYFIYFVVTTTSGWLCACVERNDCFALMRSRTTIDR